MALLPSAFRAWAPSTTTAAKYVATRSVLNPLLWLSGIITPICVVATLFAPPALVLPLLALAALPPTAAVIAFAGFAFRNPNRLQSEEFIIQQQWVAAQIGDNRTHEVLTLEGERASPSANTALGGIDDRG